MDILKIIHASALPKRLQFIVIGGHAIGAQGYSRATSDFDLMIQNKDRNAWKTLMLDLGYEIFNEQESFMQFDSPKTRMWPVDLMCSSENTFTGVLATSALKRFGDIELPVPSVIHLISMKLHALKSRGAENQGKDRGDISELLKIAKLKTDSLEFRQMCQKFGTMEMYDEFNRRSEKK